MLDRLHAGVLEALLDERLTDLRPALPVEAVAALEAAGLLDEEARAAARDALAAWREDRRIEWATRTVAQGELLSAFARHCDDELDEVDVLDHGDDVLVARWRRETSRIELRAGLVGVERLASSVPTMLLADLDAEEERVVAMFVDDATLRSRVAVCDLARLERIGAVRSSVFVYLEWFLRDAYGVKLLPSARFTQGLVDRGVISLGMG